MQLPGIDSNSWCRSDGAHGTRKQTLGAKDGGPGLTVDSGRRFEETHRTR